MVNQNILKILRCPRSGTQLHHEGNSLISEEGSVYPIYDDIIDFVIDSDPGNRKVEKGYRAIAESKYDRLVKSPFLMKFLWGIDLSRIPSLDTFYTQFPDGNILDIPCGTGAFENDFYKIKQNATFIAVDYTMDMIRRKKAKCEQLGIKNVIFIRADVARLPFSDGSLDSCLSLNGLHVFPRPEKAAKEIGRCLKPDTSVLASVVCSKIRMFSDVMMKCLMIPRGIYMNCLPFSTYRKFFENSNFVNFNIIFQNGSLIIFQANKK